MKKKIPLTKEEYNLLVRAGYQLEPYEDLCVVKSGDLYYREEYKRMLETAREILGTRKRKVR